MHALTAVDGAQEILEGLGIAHVSPERIAEVLAEAGMSMKELWDSRPVSEGGVGVEPEPVKDFQEWGPNGPRPRVRTTPPDVWDRVFDVTQVNPKRKFYPGQLYNPEDLSPLSMSNEWKEKQAELRAKGCPLGGKKGPKIEFTNVYLLSRSSPAIPSS